MPFVAKNNRGGALPARWTLLALSLVAASASAQLTIEITGGGQQRRPIAVAPFAGEAALPPSISSIIRGDLERTGMFRMLEVPALNPALTEASAVNYGEWNARLAEALVVGSVVVLPGGRFETRVRVDDVVKQARLGAVGLPTAKDAVRLVGHRAADYVYEKLTGERGVFSTLISYVVKRGDAYELQIADADGMGAQTILKSHEPIISPTWSPDGKRLAYVSFEAKKPVVYVHSIQDAKRTVAANFRGSNSAPAWAPDGSRLAVTLSREGGSQIFVMAPNGSGVRRLTTSQSIDTEPRFSPDGRWLYFTSDRGGTPQIYRMAATGGEPQRITFEGGYNVTPRPSPDGRTLAYITRNGGKFQVALLDLNNRQVQILTDSDRDESPSFSPNGRMILLATVINGRGVLSAVSADGRVKQRLTTTAGDVREPAWGPFID
jgi:TolB protein